MECQYEVLRINEKIILKADKTICLVCGEIFEFDTDAIYKGHKLDGAGDVIDLFELPNGAVCPVCGTNLNQIFFKCTGNNFKLVRKPKIQA